MRPCKPRCIGGLPPFSRYVPEGGPADSETRIGLDMLEALRLVDAEGRPQDEAAAAMDVSTATLCRILGEARRQVATALCQGRNIIIEGGNIMFRENSAMQCRGYGPHGMMGRKQAAACGGREDGAGRRGRHGRALAERERETEQGAGHGHGQGPCGHGGGFGKGIRRRARAAGEAGSPTTLETAEE